MLSPEIIKAYNAVRTTPDKSVLCHAPFTNLNFEQNGNVTACCYNRTHVLGTYPKDNLIDIWYSKQADELRGYIKDNNLDGGCSLCKKQLLSHNFKGMRARGYDWSADNKLVQLGKSIKEGLTRGKWQPMPTSMEFELSNTCNLECVMCNGYFSSSIRKNRENASPFTNPYDSAFVEQLIPFMPYLKDARFLGGEPFLIDIYYQIWDALVIHNPGTRIHITTNATVLNQRTKTLLEKLQCSIILSIDSIVKETYERIRLNAKFDRVWENFEYFYEYTKRKGTEMSFAICPITLNWHEMPGIVEYCNKKGIKVFFNTVILPQEYSLINLPAAELERIVAFYQSFTLPNTTLTEQYNKQMFDDMVKLVVAWQEQTSIIENAINTRDKNVRETIDGAVNSGIIAPEHINNAVKGIMYEILTYASAFPYSDDESGKKQQEIDTQKLFSNLHKLFQDYTPNEYLIALFAAYKYFPLMYKGAFTANGHQTKIDEVLLKVADIENAQWIARDMNFAEPFKVLEHMNGHTAHELIEGIYQRYL
jgi:MoaA/NifB/PqqE/SkfB family radical SAM enzyme